MDDLNQTQQETGKTEPDYKDLYLRLFAEFDNFRKRTQRESIDIIRYSNTELIKKLLEPLNNFERATFSENDVGFKLIYENFKQILNKEGLEEISATNILFDANIHEALFKENSDLPENHVCKILEKGYKLKDKVIKHAKVSVT